MIPLIELPLLKVIAAILIVIVGMVGYEDVHLYLHKHTTSSESQQTQNIKKNILESPHYIYTKSHLLNFKGVSKW